MNKYLSNLALFMLTDRAKELNIIPDCGSHMIKQPRKQKYSLVDDDNNMEILNVEFHHHQRPIFSK